MQDKDVSDKLAKLIDLMQDMVKQQHSALIMLGEIREGTSPMETLVKSGVSHNDIYAGYIRRSVMNGYTHRLLGTPEIETKEKLIAFLLKPQGSKDSFGNEYNIPSHMDLILNPECAKAHWGTYKVDDCGIRVAVKLKTDTNSEYGYLSDTNTQYKATDYAKMLPAWAYHLQHLVVLDNNTRYKYLLKVGKYTDDTLRKEI
jgi:hypothetical protein